MQYLPESTTSPRNLYSAAVLCAVLTLPAMLIDLPLARWPMDDRIPGDMHRIFAWSEVFAHGYGVAIIGLTVLVLDGSRRAQIPRLLASAYAAGLLANLAKLVVARVRPRYFAFDGNVIHTFLGFIPNVFGCHSHYQTGFQIQSFPSGHAATAVGLAAGLTRLYPRGGPLFFSFAFLAAWQRLDVQAHYLSDAVAAASIGFLGAACVADRRLLGRWFDELEKRGSASAPAA